MRIKIEAMHRSTMSRPNSELPSTVFLEAERSSTLSKTIHHLSLFGRVCAILCIVTITAIDAEFTFAKPKLENQRPIVGETTIGGAPVKGARQVDVSQITIGEGTAAGHLVVTTEANINASMNPGVLMLSHKSINSNVELYNVPDLADTARAIKAGLDQMEGSVIEAQINRRTGEKKLRVTVGDKTRNFTLTKTDYSTPISQIYFGGQHVWQGKEMMRLGLSTITYGIDHTATDGVLVARASGYAIYNDRTVIVLNLTGDASVDQETLEVGGQYLVDIETGLALYGEIRLQGSTKDGRTARAKLSQMIVMD